MMRQGRESRLEGIVLSRELSGERHCKLTLLSPESGVEMCLWRVSRKPEADKPDLFDRAELELTAAAGGIRFANSYRVVSRQPFLGRDYRRLTLACRMALLLARNPPPAESAPGIFRLSEAVLAALAERPLPESAYFKFLWQWMRMEGYPVREQWLEGATAQMRGGVAAVLNLPLDQQVAAAEEIAGWTRSLERWMAGECQFLLPD